MKTAKTFNRGVAMPFNKYTGEKRTINGQDVVVYQYDEDGDVLLARGTVTITDGASGYAKGCTYIKTDVSTGTTGQFDNVGTNTSSNFDAIGAGGGATAFTGLTDTPANYTSAANKIVKVNTGGTALEFVTISGDVAMSATGVTTVTDLTISGEAQGDLLQRGAAGWQKLTSSAQGDIIQMGATIWEVITGASDGDVLRYSTGSSAWAAVDPSTLPAGVASGLANNVTCEAGASDYTIDFGTAGGAYTLTVPAVGGARTFAFINEAQTFSANQTFGQTGLLLQGGDSNTCNIKINETLTGAKTLNIKINDTDRTVDLSGNLTLAGNFTTAGAWTHTGAHTLGLTTTSNTALTLPTTGTLATLAGSEVFTNKTLTSAVLNTGVSGTAVLDEDDMSSDSATQIATQQSIKAYVDAGTVTFTNKTISADGTGNVISNINADEMDPVAIPSVGDATDTVYGQEFTLMVFVSNQAAAVSIYSSDAPFKFLVVDAWSINASASGGTWKIDDGTSDLCSAVTVAGSDTDIDRVVDMDDANSTIASGGSLRVVPDGGGAMDAYIFIKCLRVD